MNGTVRNVFDVAIEDHFVFGQDFTLMVEVEYFICPGSKLRRREIRDQTRQRKSFPSSVMLTAASQNA